MIAVDGTVVRPPLSGVHYAVQSQVLALLDAFPQTSFAVLATCPELRAAATEHGRHAPTLSPLLRQAPWRIIWQQARLPALLEQLSCRRLLALAYTAPLHARVPVVLQVHDTIALHSPRLCRYRNVLHMRALLRASAGRAESILTPSRHVADELVRLLGHGRRVHPVGLGIDDIFIHPPVTTTPGGAAPPYLLFVGNLEPKKGVALLLDAYATLSAAADIDLVLVGRPGWKCRRLLRRIDRWPGPGRVVRRGYVARAELPALYRQAVAVVMPSREEGFGLPILEAMAVGTPVVHSDHPTLTETAGGFGHPFAAGNAGALADVLQQLAAAPGQARERLGAARQWARTRTWRRWAEEAADVTGMLN